MVYTAPGEFLPAAREAPAHRTRTIVVSAIRVFIFMVILL
jgi:hypothetical protein